MRTQVFADFSKVKYDKDSRLRCPECRKHFSSLVVAEVVTKKGGRVNKLRCSACAGVSAVNTVSVPHEDTPAPKPRARPKASGTKGKTCIQCGAAQDLFMSLATGSLLCRSCMRPDEAANYVPYIPLGQETERHHKSSRNILQPQVIDRPGPAMGGLGVDLSEPEIPLDHLQGGVAQEEMRTINITLVAQVGEGEGVPEPVGVDILDTRPPAEAAQV